MRIKEETFTYYVADNGQHFSSEERCLAFEASLRSLEKYQNYAIQTGLAILGNDEDRLQSRGCLDRPVTDEVRAYTEIIARVTAGILYNQPRCTLEAAVQAVLKVLGAVQLKG